MSRTSRTLSVLLLSVAIVNCSGSESDAESDGETSKSSAPVTAIKSFLMAGNEGDYAKAETYVSSGAQESLKRMGGAQTMLDMITRDRTLKDLEVISETPTEQGQVVVYLLLRFKDDQVSNGTYTLIQEGGAWKIGL